MASQLAEAYVTVSMNAAKMPEQLAGLKSMVSDAIGDMASRFAMTGFVFRRLVDAAKDFASAIGEDEEQAIRFSAAVDASGRGEVFTKMVERIGQASEAITAFSADAIRAAATAIAPFQTLSNEMAGKVLEVAKDLTAQFGGELSGNARTLASALERPESGMRRLRAIGVTLTAQQQDQIKTMLELGNTAGAQARILDIAVSKSAGAAERLGGTLKSLYARIKTEMGELAETMGRKMMPDLKAFDQTAIKTLKEFRSLLEGETIASKLAQIGTGLLGLAIAGSAVVGVFTTMRGLLFASLGPWGWAAAAIATVAAQFISLSDVIEAVTSQKEKAIADSAKRLREQRQQAQQEQIRQEEAARRRALIAPGQQPPGAEYLAPGKSPAGFSGHIPLSIWNPKEAEKQKQELNELAERIRSTTEDAYGNFFRSIEDVMKLGPEAGSDLAIRSLAKSYNELLESLGGFTEEGLPVATQVFEDFWDKIGAMIPPDLADRIFSEASRLSGVERAIDEYRKNQAARETVERSSIEGQFTNAVTEAARALEGGASREMVARSLRRQYDHILEEANKLGEQLPDITLLRIPKKLLARAIEALGAAKELPETKSRMTTGFVGIAEFAKQFQASVLKSEADRYAKETAEHTGTANEHLKEIAQHTATRQSPFANLA